jgi:hypothetical protein
VVEYISEIRDGMGVEWDVPIRMDDGVVLRADVFRPVVEGRYPVIMTHGPYAEGLPFQDGFPGMWGPLSTKYPDAVAGTTNKYQNWETADPEKWVPNGYICPSYLLLPVIPRTAESSTAPRRGPFPTGEALSTTGGVPPGSLRQAAWPLRLHLHHSSVAARLTLVEEPFGAAARRAGQPLPCAGRPARACRGRPTAPAPGAVPRPPRRARAGRSPPPAPSRSRGTCRGTGAAPR